MKLESYGILIGLRPFGERDCIAHIFTRDHGVMCGMIRGGQSAKKNKPLIGQVGPVSWNARVDSQLGAFHFEAEKNMAAPIMMDGKLLGIMNSAFALVALLLPERENYGTVFEHLLLLLKQMDSEPGEHILEFYLAWERTLLQELGYALNLKTCSNCGRTDNLNYLSPRTGRAVCDDCAKPYLGRVFELPLNLGVTRKFLEMICDSQGVTLPLARKMIANL
ncbi:DNA repair protein RecO [Lachnospiraceae bacterium OttesenSCG-928-E19]|nr:DNA repair protein RecO [Lachnospiraceae bacterium OttesenSCG-928-E19]